MTDRELLELAAKAAGIEYDVEAYKPHPVSKAFWGLWLVIHGEPSEYQRRNWNPLTDDGDALRLMSSLRLDILWAEHERSVVACNDSSNDSPVIEKVRFTTDPTAGTRRAIVRAAAEIGKAMP